MQEIVESAPPEIVEAEETKQPEPEMSLTKEEPTEANAHKGYVHQIYEEIFADKRPAHFYLCGWRNMIDEAKQRIVTMGYDRKAVHVEIYG